MDIDTTSLFADAQLSASNPIYDGLLPQLLGISPGAVSSRADFARIV